MSFGRLMRCIPSFLGRFGAVLLQMSSLSTIVAYPDVRILHLMRTLCLHMSRLSAAEASLLPPRASTRPELVEPCTATFGKTMPPMGGRASLPLPARAPGACRTRRHSIIRSWGRHLALPLGLALHVLLVVILESSSQIHCIRSSLAPIAHNLSPEL